MTAVKYVHPAEPALELLTEHHLLDVLPDLLRFVRSCDSGRAPGAAPPVSRFDEAKEVGEKDLATAHGR